jgi:hypothetical protein
MQAKSQPTEGTGSYIQDKMMAIAMLGSNPTEILMNRGHFSKEKVLKFFL